MAIPNPLFLVASETIKAWPTFLPGVATVRHFEPRGFQAFDVRLGYGLALSWSLVVAFAVTGADGKQGYKPLLMWAICAASMTAVYEIALRNESDIREVT